VTTLPAASSPCRCTSFQRTDGPADDAGVLLTGTQPLLCAVEQPIQSPAIDCPLVVEFVGHGRNETITIAGYRRLRIRPFDPSRDRSPSMSRPDARLLAMYEALTGPDFDTEDVRAFCRLFSACVRPVHHVRQGVPPRHSHIGSYVPRRTRIAVAHPTGHRPAATPSRPCPRSSPMYARPIQQMRVMWRPGPALGNRAPQKL